MEVIIKSLQETVGCDTISLSWNYQVKGGSSKDVHLEVGIKGELANGKFWKTEPSQKKKSHLITGLKPDTEYSIYVSAFDKDDEQLCQYPDTDEGLVVKTAIEDTEAPDVSSTTLKVTDVSSEGFTVVWKKATDKVTADEEIAYSVGLKESGETELLVSQVVHDIDSFVFTGVEPGKTYEVIVSACDEAGNETMYDSEFVTVPVPKDTDEPKVGSREITVTDRTCDSISIEWERAKDNVTEDDKIRYAVYLSEGGDFEIKEEAPGICSYTFTGLKPETSYVFKVKAFDDAGNDMAYSQDADMTLAKAETTTVDDNMLIVTNRTKDSISIEWGLAKGLSSSDNKIRYEIHFYDAGVYFNHSNRSVVVRAAEGIHTHTFTGLKDSTLYAFYVKAIDEKGKEYRFPTKMKMTMDIQAPTVKCRTITATKITRDSITIRWEPADDNRTLVDKIKYQIYVTESGKSNSPWKLEEERNGIMQYRFTELRPNTEYAFFVKAFDEAGNILRYPTDAGVFTAKTKLI